MSNCAAQIWSDQIRSHLINCAKHNYEPNRQFLFVSLYCQSFVSSIWHFFDTCTSQINTRDSDKFVQNCLQSCSICLCFQIKAASRHFNEICTERRYYWIEWWNSTIVSHKTLSKSAPADRSSSQMHFLQCQSLRRSNRVLGIIQGVLSRRYSTDVPDSLAIPLSFAAYQVWGANTDVGKTLVSAGLMKIAAESMQVTLFVWRSFLAFWNGLSNSALSNSSEVVCILEELGKSFNLSALHISVQLYAHWRTLPGSWPRRIVLDLCHALLLLISEKNSINRSTCTIEALKHQKFWLAQKRGTANLQKGSDSMGADMYN